MKVFLKGKKSQCDDKCQWVENKYTENDHRQRQK